MASRGHAARMALQDQPRLDEFQVRAEPGNGPIDVTRHRDLTDAWLWRLGPASTLLYGELARLSLMPDPPCIDVAAMSRWLGVAPWTFWKAMDRLVMFGRVTWVSGDVLGVHVTAPRPAPRTLADHADAR